MRFVSLKTLATAGADCVWVNPAHVVTVDWQTRETTDGTRRVPTGRTVLTLVTGETVLIADDPNFVVDMLEAP